MNITDAERESLRWYVGRANSGRGKLTRESAKFVKLGLLDMAWTSVNCWVLTLSLRGKTLLGVL